MKQQSYRGGAGNFANDPERAKEAGRALSQLRILDSIVVVFDFDEIGFF
jgi:hypothetical protein